MLVKGIVDHGWYAEQLQVSAPRSASSSSTIPQGADSLNLLLIRFLALFSRTRR